MYVCVVCVYVTHWPTLTQTHTHTNTHSRARARTHTHTHTLMRAHTLTAAAAALSLSGLFGGGGFGGGFGARFGCLACGLQRSKTMVNDECTRGGCVRINHKWVYRGGFVGLLCLLVGLFYFVCVCLFTYLFVCLFICFFVWLFICLRMFLSFIIIYYHLLLLFGFVTDLLAVLGVTRPFILPVCVCVCVCV